TKAAAETRLTPGDAHQATDLLRGHRLAGQLALDQADLVVEEVDLAQAAIDGFALVRGKLERGQPPTSRLAKDVCHRRAALQVSGKHRVALVLCSRARAHELWAALQPSAQGARELIG